MFGKEWALIGFTLLSEMAIGAFWILWFIHFRARQHANDEEVRKLSNFALLGIGPIMVIGMLVSLYHLGSPLNSWQAIGNLGSSWLSREIFFALAFFVMWFVCAVMQWRSTGTEGLRGLWAILTSLVGLATIISTSMVYFIPSRPAWFDSSTPLSFIESALLLGALAVGTVFTVYYLTRGKSSEIQTGLIKAALKNISLIVMGVIVVQAFTLLFQAAYLTNGTVETRATAQAMFGPMGVWFWLRVLVGLVAGFVLAWFGWQALARADLQLPAMATRLVIATFICVLIGEVVGRWLFYLTVVQVKLPGAM